MSTAPRCTACGHLALLHAPIGGEPAEGDLCVICQCTGLQTSERDEDDSVRESAEGGGA